MDHFPDFKDDVDFTEHLVMEQSVFCLPASVGHTLPSLLLHRAGVQAHTIKILSTFYLSGV